MDFQNKKRNANINQTQCSDSFKIKVNTIHSKKSIEILVKPNDKVLDVKKKLMIKINEGDLERFKLI